MSDSAQLLQKINQRFDSVIQEITIARNEISLEISAEQAYEVCLALRDEADFKFELLIDVCVVDYAEYGVSEWTTERSTLTGFERAVDSRGDLHPVAWNKPRFAVVYHLLSLIHNQRCRLRIFAKGEPPQVLSVVKLWPSANWYEREAFDLYGVFFNGHPDLRRLLTDYGFVGHPFRKDFPLTGHVEVRYDATEGRVIYQPVTVTPRTLVPKTIRKTAQEDTLTCFHKEPE